MLADPSNDTPPISLAVDKTSALVALPDNVVAVNVPLIETLLKFDVPDPMFILPANVGAVTVPEK